MRSQLQEENPSQTCVHRHHWNELNSTSYFSLCTLLQCATGAQGCSGKGFVLLTALHGCQERGEALCPHCILCKFILE